MKCFNKLMLGSVLVGLSASALAAGQCTVVVTNNLFQTDSLLDGGHNVLELRASTATPIDGVFVGQASDAVHTFEGEDCQALFHGGNIRIELNDTGETFVCSPSGMESLPMNRPFYLHIMHNGNGYQCFVNIPA